MFLENITRVQGLGSPGLYKSTTQPGDIDCGESGGRLALGSTVALATLGDIEVAAA